MWNFSLRSINRYGFWLIKLTRIKIRITRLINLVIAIIIRKLRIRDAKLITTIWIRIMW